MSSRQAIGQTQSQCNFGKEPGPRKAERLIINDEAEKPGRNNGDWGNPKSRNDTSYKNTTLGSASSKRVPNAFLLCLPQAGLASLSFEFCL